MHNEDLVTARRDYAACLQIRCGTHTHTHTHTHAHTHTLTHTARLPGGTQRVYDSNAQGGGESG